MIIVNNGVTNLRGTPACYTDFSFNRPLANAVTVGSLFFATDTNLIYQVHLVGAVPTWESMGGGGGGTQDLNDVLFQGGTFTNYRTSNLNNYGWELTNVNYFKLKNTNNQKFWFTDNGYNYYNNANVNNLFSLTFGNGDFALGDFSGEFNGTHMFINTSSNRIYFAPGGYLSFLNEPGIVKLGDGFNSWNQTQFVCDDTIKQVYTKFGGAENGISLNFDYNGFGVPIFKFGDYEGLGDGGYLYIDDAIMQSRNLNNGFGFYFDSGSYYTAFGDYEVIGEGGRLTIFSTGTLPFASLIASESFNSWGFRVEVEKSDGISIDSYISTMGDFAIFDNLAPYIKTVLIPGFEQYISFGNANTLYFENCSILTTSSGGNSGQHLKVTINGTPYVITLNEP